MKAVNQQNEDQASLLSRLHVLEKEIRSLRDRLRPSRERLPDQPFRCLLVGVDEQQYALPLDTVRKVVPLPYCDGLPDVPYWVHGSFQLGEDTVAVVNLASRLSGERKNISVDQFVVLLDHHPRLGLIVDTVGDIFTVEPDAIEPPPNNFDVAEFVLGLLHIESASEGFTSVRLLAPASVINEWSALAPDAE